MHVVDMFPTLAGLAGASTEKGKPLDGVNVWSTISEGKPSPRQEVVYNIEPFRGGVRQGDWKLIWRTPLPSKLELFNIAQDPYEKTNLADKNPQIVASLQKRIEELAAGKRQAPVPGGCIQRRLGRRPRCALAAQRRCVFHTGRLRTAFDDSIRPRRARIHLGLAVA